MTEDERTTAVGLYHYARSYRAAAEHLKEARLRTTHPDAPVTFLYFHAMELYLKSFLRLQGIGVHGLKDVGHRFDRLANEAKARRMIFDDEDSDVILAMAETDVVMQSRYIRTGPFTRPTMEALSRTTLSFHRSAFEALRAAGEPVRD